MGIDISLNLEGLSISSSRVDTEPSLETVTEELRERLTEFGTSKRKLTEQEDSLKKLARRVAHLKSDGDVKEKCGNKHVNLIKMGRVVNPLKTKDFNIPMPQSLSTDEIKDFWQKRKPEILTNWADLRQHHQEYKDTTPFLQNPKTEEILEKIHKAIEESFDANEEAPLPQEWLIEKKDQYLMVRSSGAEDSEKTANAGGNVSIAYVPASDMKAVCKAVGSVVQSYFGKNSLQNRINAGLNPFEEDLSLGVVLQELIGEPVGGAKTTDEIPVSFVLFTNEPLFVGGEPFRVMQLSATYGHGEAVVGEQGIATDTAYLLHSVANPETLFILYTNRKKLERLAPVSTNPIVLSSVANPTDLVHQPCLSEKLLLQIYKDAICVEGIFEDHPTDIEGVVKNGTVHFVQARPVIRKPMLPTYLPSNAAILQTLQAEAIVPATASVVTIRDRNEILTAHTLEEAEEKYQATNPPKLVIVTKLPSATSHPVVNFRGLNIPCLCVANIDEREKILGQIQGNNILAVCMQTATLNVWDTSRADVEKEIQQGFAVHPASLSISLPIPRFAITPASLEEIAPGKKMIQTSDWNGIHQRIAEFDQEIQKLRSIAKHPLHPAIAERLESLSILRDQLQNALDEVRASENDLSLRLRGLFYKKVLEALFTGTSSPGKAIGQFSYFDAKNILKDIEELIAYESQLSFPSRLLDLLPLGSFDKVAWQKFLLAFEPLIHRGAISEEKIQNFRKLMQEMYQAKALPFWFTFFCPQFSLTQGPDRVFDQIISQTTAQDLELLTPILESQEKIQRIDTQIQKFSDPKTWENAWKNLQILTATFSNASWLQSIHTGSSPVLKAIAYRTMGEAVDLLDRAVKELKASQSFPRISEKVSKFKEMLHPYYELMHSWILSLSYSDLLLLEPTDHSVSSYLSQVQWILGSRTDLPRELLPSSTFSVSAALLGAKTAFNRHLPETLEDILTLLHQNALVALNLFNQNLLDQNRIDNSLLPIEIKQAMHQIERTHWGQQAQRIGLQMEPDAVRVLYNVPLRNHSGHLEIIYQTDTGKILIQAQFLGQERNRWGEIAGWVNALDRAGFISLASPVKQTPLELTFTWEVEPEQLETCLKEYDGMAEWSFERYSRTDVLNIYDRWSEQLNFGKFIEEFMKCPPGISNRFHDILEEKRVETQAAMKILVPALIGLHALGILYQTGALDRGSTLLLSKIRQLAGPDPMEKILELAQSYQTAAMEQLASFTSKIQELAGPDPEKTILEFGQRTMDRVRNFITGSLQNAFAT